MIVTRFAPSPTGFMHVGGVRTALFAWLYAKKHDGIFILRIEDTDQKREVEGSLEHIQESLKWLGLTWDYGPDNNGPFGSCIQSERLQTYREAAQKLVDRGLAYPDPYSEEEVEAFRKKAEEEKRPFLYRDYRPEKIESWDGKRPLRFKVPEIKRYRWSDAVRGNLEAGEEAVDDIVLIKGDGFPTYNFAHIVDDHNMGITHVFRSDEFISSMPKYLSLYDALEIAYPVFITLPPIMGPDGKKKLGKRDGAKDILEYRNEGYVKDAMVNFLAFIGWNPGIERELFTPAELIQVFSVEQIQIHGGALNEEKLRWFNREHLLRLSPEEFWQHALEFLSKETLRGLAENKLHHRVALLMRERIHMFGELRDMDREGEWAYFFKMPACNAATLVPKNATLAETHTRLSETLKLLSALSENDWNEITIKKHVWSYAEKEGKGNVLWPLRYALSGKEKSPDPFTIAGIIGKDETKKRIQRAVELLDS